MKRLILARHAKASNENTNLPDFDRSLSDEGRNDGEVIVRLLNEKMSAPDLILASSAARTRETTTFFQQAFPDAEIEFRKELYLATPITLKAAAETVDDDIESVMLVAHNPGLTELHNQLCQNRLISHLEPLGVSEISLEMNSWTELEGTPGHSLQLLTPGGAK